MNKNIIIALLTVLLILSIAFGFYQKTEAGKFEALAIENGKIAREAAINAENQMELAQQQRVIAMMEANQAREQLISALAQLEKLKRAN